MTVSALHEAVWDGNVAQIKAFLTQKQSELDPKAFKDMLEAKDVHGNTALHLAIRICQPTQREIIQLLLTHNANVHARNVNGWSCVQDAVITDDEFLVALLFVYSEKQLYQRFQENLDTLCDTLEKLQDFSCQIHIETHSWIPGVSQLLPSDTICLYKKGSQLRWDYTLEGFQEKTFKWKRGQLTHLFMGRQQRGHLFMINHETKEIIDLIQMTQRPSIVNMDLGIHLLVTQQATRSTLDGKKLSFVPRKKVFDLKKKTTQNCPWTGTKYRMKNLVLTVHFRTPFNSKRPRKEFAAKDKRLDTFEQFVSQVTTSKSKQDEDTKKTFSSLFSKQQKRPLSTSSDTLQQLTLQRGRPTQMQLDVSPGDCIKWHFLSKSVHFKFQIEYFYQDQVIEICKTQGVKNIPIHGFYTVGNQGSFVLTWTNTLGTSSTTSPGSPGSTGNTGNTGRSSTSLLERKVKIMYQIQHIRPQPVIQPPPAAPSVVMTTMNNDPILDLCQVFDPLTSGQIPSPLIVTTCFQEYFQMDNRTEKNRTFRNLTVVPRPHQIKKTLDGKILISDDKFPFQPPDFQPILDFLAQSNHELTSSLQDFFQMELPKGFPVKFELPVFPSVKVSYTFQSVHLDNNIDATLFDFPKEYTVVNTKIDNKPSVK